MIILVLLTCLQAFAQDALESKLRSYVNTFHLRPLQPPPPMNEKIFHLGRHLFHERALSGNNNISCVECHHPKFGTTDGLPLALGEGSVGIGANREQRDARIIARNSPSLMNLHLRTHLFWDGRVSRDAHGVLTTPLKALNGLHPERPDITKLLTSTLAAQSIFPLLNQDEMRGLPGSNPIADTRSDLEAFDLLVHRLLQKDEYLPLFQDAFPGEKINIGHVGMALAEFQRIQFYKADTPYDRWLKGDAKALTVIQKKGMDLFFGDLGCVGCHSGEELTDGRFRSVAAPQIGPGKHEGDDQGRPDISFDQPYTFRVPGLRNVALTAPYMHDGAFATLEDVVNHYNDIPRSLENYRLQYNGRNYNSPLADHDRNNNPLRLANLSIEMSFGLGLSDEKKSWLVEFLRTGLTDVSLTTKESP